MHTVNATFNVMVSMRDGVMLATDIYRPADENGKLLEGQFPVILGRTSYDKSNPVIWVDPIANFFVPRGYVVLLQDLRGRGESEGTGQYFHTANQLEGKDGYDTIEWAAEQPWCNGKVGMVGASHGGIVQNMASLERPPHLAALWVDVAPTNAFKWEARQGGAMGLQMYGALYLHGYDSHELRGNPEAREKIERGAENLRNELLRLLREPLRPGETPIAAVPNLEKILFHYYYDGVYNDFWSQESLDHSPHFARMADIPAVYSSGWYDPFPADVTEQFAAMTKQNSTPQRLVVGPWNHVLMRGKGSTSVGEVEFGETAKWGDEVFNTERLRWFDRWLKGEDSGAEETAPVRIFVMGGGSGRKNASGNIEHGDTWRSEQEWPLARATETNMYLRQAGALSNEPSSNSEKTITWTYDPQNPTPSIGANVTGMYEWVPLNDGLDPAYIPQRARMRSVIPDGPMHQQERPELLCCAEPYPLLKDRTDVITFESEPLENPVEVTGAPKVRLWISSSATDTDFTAKLLDIYPPSDDWPEGFHLPLADSIIRTRFRAGFDAERLMTPGEIYEVEIELPPVSNLFAAGHRIRVDISSSNFPRFDVNPNTGEPLGRHTRFEKAQNSVHMGAGQPSHITLPVVGS